LPISEGKIMTTSAEAEKPEAVAKTATATPTERHAPTTEDSDLQAEVGQLSQA
jgi:hypothetical protein